MTENERIAIALGYGKVETKETPVEEVAEPTKGKKK